MSTETKTLDNLEAGDTIKVEGSLTKYIVQVVLEGSIIVSQGGEGAYVYRFSVGHMKTKGWTVEKPLGILEKKAKVLLETLGFKVTR